MLNTANIINHSYVIIKGNFENSKSIYKIDVSELRKQKTELRMRDSKLGFGKLNGNFRFFVILEVGHALGMQEADPAGNELDFAAIAVNGFPVDVDEN